MILEASGRLTGVEAVHTEPLQWLKTTVDVAGCQVIRRERSWPRASGNTSDRVLTSSTAISMTRSCWRRYGSSGWPAASGTAMTMRPRRSAPGSSRTSVRVVDAGGVVVEGFAGYLGRHGGEG